MYANGYAKTAVVLLSGGLDSATCLAIARTQGYSCYCISFNYGQKHAYELVSAANVAQNMGCIEHSIVNLDIGKFGSSALTDPGINVPESKPFSQDIPLTYVPARNITFLSIALGYAEAKNVTDIFIGVSAVDYSNYPDCRLEFIKSFEQTANLATKVGTNGTGNKIKIHTPLISLNKAETIKLGLELGVDYSITSSCYRINNIGQACGSCDSCYLRKKGFLELGIKDPTKYVE